MSTNNVYDPVPPHGRERARLVRTLQKLSSARVTGEAISDDEIIQREGYKDSATFWAAALAEWMTISEYVNLIRGFNLSPAPENLQALGLSIVAALRRAYRSGQDIFIRDAFVPKRPRGTLTGWMVQPRRATEWLLSLPTERGLVPESLRAFLEQSQSRGIGLRSSDYNKLVERIREILRDGKLSKETVIARLREEGMYRKSWFEDAWRETPAELKLGSGEHQAKPADQRSQNRKGSGAI